MKRLFSIAVLIVVSSVMAFADSLTVDSKVSIQFYSVLFNDKPSKAMLALSLKKPFPAKIQNAFADGDAISTDSRMILGTITGGQEQNPNAIRTVADFESFW